MLLERLCVAIELVLSVRKVISEAFVTETNSKRFSAVAVMSLSLCSYE
jgi:hypothetical protein